MEDDGELHDALILLRRSIDTQNELQEEANGIMRGLVDALQKTAQEIQDLRDQLSEPRG